MNKLKVLFTNFWPEWNMEDFITPILKKNFNIEINNRSPDIVFHSIFGNHAEFLRFKGKRVVILGENHSPRKFKPDYSISFEPHSDTNYRLPIWQMFILKKPELWDNLINRVKWESFDEFCSFTVSNPSNVLRIQHYEQLSNYKQIKSYGKVRTNSLKLRRLSEGRYWRDAKDNFFRNTKHKFTLAYENSLAPYYCTEKIMDAFLAGSIPIYWGDPKVNLDWNSKAFINVTKNKNWIDTVIELDKNEELFREMYSKPVFTDEQAKKHEENLSGFENWILKIINE